MGEINCHAQAEKITHARSKEEASSVQPFQVVGPLARVRCVRPGTTGVISPAGWLLARSVWTVDCWVHKGRRERRERREEGEEIEEIEERVWNLRFARESIEGGACRNSWSWSTSSSISSSKQQQ